MNILVTGGAGFIGSHVVEALLTEGHAITIIDNFDNCYDRQIKVNNIQRALEYSRYRLYEEDILNTDALDKIIQNGNFELIIHLAAKAGVRPSISDPMSYERTNVAGTLSLLEMCRKYKIRRFIFASSSSVYGNNLNVPYVEDEKISLPISPYAATKRSGELLCYNYHYLFDINIYAFRFFTVYGPRQRPDMAIHKFTTLINQNEVVPLFNYGQCKRDFTFITDIVNPLIKSISVMGGFEIINLGGGKTVSTIELVALLEERLGKKAEKQFLPAQPGDAEHTYADIGKAKEILDYEPETSIEQGIDRFFQWYREANRINEFI